jgi:group I intron endonuclease
METERITRKRRCDRHVVKERKPFIIYLVTSPSGKQYVGQTMRSIHIRWKQHCNSKKDVIMVRAIKKHGYENFTITLLGRAHDKENANKLERFYISKLDTIFPKGYNMSPGGGGGIIGMKRTTEDKQLKSLIKIKFYENENNRIEQSERIKKIYNTEKGKQLQKERAYLQNKPEIKEKTKQKLKLLRNTKEYKENKSIEQIQRWSDPLLRIKQSEIIKETYKKGRITWNKGKKLAPRSEETKLKLSIALKKYYKNGHNTTS